jgi:hypothetical protein
MLALIDTINNFITKKNSFYEIEARGVGKTSYQF